MNGTHWGFIRSSKQIDDQFLDWNMEDDGSNMFKTGDGPTVPGGEADLVYYGADQSSYTEQYEIENNEDLNDWTDLIAFIDFIITTTDTEFETGIDDRFEPSVSAVWPWITSFSIWIPTSTQPCNYYIYHHMKEPAGGTLDQMGLQRSFWFLPGRPNGGGLS